MLTLLQRVSQATVTVDGKITGAIDHGLLALVGVAEGDTSDDVAFTAQKIGALRIFSDEDGKFNLSLADVGGSLLLVSQFTLLGDTRKGRRPSFSKAAPPEQANALFEELAALMKTRFTVATGVFGAHMEVSLVNDGPVTLIIDTSLTRRGNPRGEPR